MDAEEDGSAAEREQEGRTLGGPLISLAVVNWRSGARLGGLDFKGVRGESRVGRLISRSKMALGHVT